MTINIGGVVLSPLKKPPLNEWKCLYCTFFSHMSKAIQRDKFKHHKINNAYMLLICTILNHILAIYFPDFHLEYDNNDKSDFQL